MKYIFLFFRFRYIDFVEDWENIYKIYSGAILCEGEMLISLFFCTFRLPHTAPADNRLRLGEGAIGRLPVEGVKLDTVEENVGAA